MSHRNKYGEDRMSGTVQIRAPRVGGNNQDFEFGVPRLYQRPSDAIKQLMPALCLIYILIAKTQKSRRKINAPDTIVEIVQEVKFENGAEVKLETRKQWKAAA